MKHLLVLFFSFCLIISPLNVEAQQSKNSDNTFRVVSYNIRNGNGMDNINDLDRVAEALNKLNPTMIAVQEIDSVTGRSNQRDVLRELAERTLMHRVYAPAIDHDGGKYGIGILSKEKPKTTRSIPLPGTEEKRMLLVAEFEHFILACTHLSLTGEDRMASLDIIRKEAAAATKPFLLAGDLNARPDSSFITSLQEDFQLLNNVKTPTFPATEPKVCIDYIACYKQAHVPLTLLASHVANEPMASDHRPVVVDLRSMAKKEEIFRTKPYLQNPTGGGITVSWQTTVPTYSWIEYGTDSTQMQVARTLVDGQVICNDTHAKIRLTDLTPGQKYYYRAYSQEITLYEAYKKEFGETATSPLHSFTLPSEDTTDFTAIIFNDLHKQEATLKALYAQVKDFDYDFVVFNGDCIDDPRTEDIAITHMSVQCETVGASNKPVFYLRGNHEIRDAYSIGLRSLLDYVGDKTYGAFNWGDTRIVMLDCGEDKPDSTWVYYNLNDFTQLRLDQVDFLKEELSSQSFKQASKRVLINHIPVYGNSNSYHPCTELWGELLANAPFDINLSAHLHRYAYHPKGTVGNNFPVVIGGHQQIDGSTVMVLQKKNNVMTLQVINTKGERMLTLQL